MRVGRNLASRARLAVCCQSRWSGLVVKGQKLHRDDPVVQANPEAFAVVTPLAKSSAPAL